MNSELRDYIGTQRGQYLIAKALAYAANYFNPSEDSKEMAHILTKYFPQFPELLGTNIIDDVVLENKDRQLTFWEAMAEMAWSSELPDDDD